MNIGNIYAGIAGGFFLAAATVLISPKDANAVTINFDEVVARPTSLLSHDHYRNLGVDITLIRPNGTRPGFQVVREPYGGNGAYSNPNGVAFGFGGSLLEVVFVDPLTGAQGLTDFAQVVVGDLSGEADPMTGIAFNAAGEVLAIRSFTSQPSNVLGSNFGFLTFDLTGIARLLFSDRSPSGATLDNLTFAAVRGPGGGGGGGTQVPEPATMGLLISGLLGAATARRKALR